MAYHLCIGNRACSSWSQRGRPLSEASGLHADATVAPLCPDDIARVLAGFAPARTVPALRLTDGIVVADSLAIAEELAARHPDAGHCPADPHARRHHRTVALRCLFGGGCVLCALRGPRRGWRAATCQ